MVSWLKLGPSKLRLIFKKVGHTCFRASEEQSQFAGEARAKGVMKGSGIVSHQLMVAARSDTGSTMADKPQVIGRNSRHKEQSNTNEIRG